MKIPLGITTLLLASFLAYGDTVIVESVESSAFSGKIAIKLKGDLARIDAAIVGHEQTVIVDLAKGKSSILIPAIKKFTELDLGAFLKAQDQALFKAGISNAQQKPKPTGQQGKVGNWNADIYDGVISETPIELWVVQGIPNAAMLEENLRKLSRTATLPDYSVFDVPGMVVKSEITTPKEGKVTTTITSLEETPVAEGEFVIPADYQKFGAPASDGASGGK